MPDKSFYKNCGPFKLSEIAYGLNCRILGNKDKIIKDISTLEVASTDDISFLSNKKYIDVFHKTEAGVVIIEEKYIDNIKKKKLFDI